MIRVINDRHKPFNVRIVRVGETYGLKDCLVNAESVMLEFYDASQDRIKFGERGQFVSRYYVNTLFKKDAKPSGLQLDGGVREWSLDTATMTQVYRYVVRQGLL